MATAMGWLAKACGEELWYGQWQSQSQSQSQSQCFFDWNCLELRLQQIKQSPSFIDEAVALACAAGAGLSSAVCIGLVVLFLEALPMAKLVLPLDHDSDHGWGAG
jgi:hypothetical protein